MSNKTLWLLLDSRHPGGIESHVLQLAEGLHQHRLNIQVVFLNNYGNHPLRNALNNKKIPTFSLNGKLSSLWSLIRRQQPALIHTHGYKAGILGRLMAKINAIPVVSTYHSGELPVGKLQIYDLLDRYSAVWASKVYVVSSEIASRLHVKSEVADNFVSTTNLTSSIGQQIAFVGRISIEKGPDIFIRLACCFPEEQFHIYGTGPMEDELKRIAPNNVTFHGQQNDMTRVWQDIGLLVMPSRYEGLPMAALEAMARSIPVIASDVGALNTLIAHNHNGWLVEPLQLGQLSHQLFEWLEMAESKQHTFKVEARDTITARFCADVVIPQLIRNYQQLANI